MKYTVRILAIAIIIILVTGCTSGAVNESVQEGVIRQYHENADGTWECEGITYMYRLEISGRMPRAAVDSTFVYLSNIEEITFEQAWRAAGLSSSADDYFAPENAVLVELSTS